MIKLQALAEKYAFYILGGAALYIMVRGASGAGQDVGKAAVGVVIGVVEGAAGAINGAYNALPETVKPSSGKNVIYQGVNKVVPGKNQTLGTWIYDLTH